MKYTDIMERCKTSANEMLPDLPTKNTLETWENYHDALESLRDESFDAVYQEVEQWDWTIYTHYGFKILEILPYSDVCDAESEFFDCHCDLDSDTLGGVYEFASKVAYFALCSMLRETLESSIDECLELAETQIENKESEE